MGKFKVGEKVSVDYFLSYEDGVHGASVVGPMIKKRGKTGTVIDRDIIDNVYAVNFDDDSCWWFGENSLMKTKQDDIQIVKKDRVDEKEIKTITVSGSTREEMQKAADEAIAKAFARVWTEEDNERAKQECLKIMENLIENTNGREHVVFSSYDDDNGETRATIIYTGGLYPRYDGGRFESSNGRCGTAKLAPYENNMPWIGRLVAVARAAGVTVPKWVYN